MLYANGRGSTLEHFNTADFELRQRLDSHFKELDDDRRGGEWFEHWRELIEYLMPRRGRFLLSDDKRAGAKFMSKVLDSEGVVSFRTLSAGMMAGMSPRSKPWMRLIPEDKKLLRVHSVKEWLSECEQTLYLIFHQSNFYQAMAQLYGELGVIGTAAMVVFEDFENVIRCETLTVGEYMLAQNSRRVCDTMMREYNATLSQLVEQFGVENLPGPYRERWETQRASVSVREQRYPIRHYVGPNPRRNERKPAISSNMPFASIYWAPECGDNGHIIQFKGFEENALIAPRWDTTGNDVYGKSPGMEVLPDVKQLQTMTRRMGQGVDRQVNPPLKGPASLKNVALDLLPGGVNLYDDAGGKGLESIYGQLRPDLQAMAAERERLEKKINRGSYADLFFAISQMPGVQPRQEMELLLRQDEKLGALGPVVDRIQPECLDPVVDRAWGICMRKGIFPDPPEEVQGQPIKVDYVSMLALAQKMLGVGNLERYAGIVGNLSAAWPEAKDKFNPDGYLDEYAEALGIPARATNSDDEVAKVRADRAQAGQAEALAAAAPALRDGAAAAKLLSEIDRRGPARGTSY